MREFVVASILLPIHSSFTCSPDIADFSLPLTPLTTDVGHDVVDVLLRAVIVVAGVSVPMFIIAKFESFISKWVLLVRVCVCVCVCVCVFAKRIAM